MQWLGLEWAPGGGADGGFPAVLDPGCRSCCAGLALGFGWTLVALALAHAEPVSAHIVGLGAVWSHPRLLGFRLPGAGRFGLALLRPLRRPMLALGAARVALPLAAPSLWRSLRYWRRIVPIFCRSGRPPRRALAGTQPPPPV